MHKKLVFSLVIIASSACQSVGHPRGQPGTAAAPDTAATEAEAPADGPKIRSLGQPDAARDGAVIGTAPVFGSAAENQYGTVAVFGAEGRRVCAVASGNAHDCEQLTRCTPVVGGRARIDYLETGKTFDVFVCGADGKPGSSLEVVVKGGEMVEVEAP